MRLQVLFAPFRQAIARLSPRRASTTRPATALPLVDQLSSTPPHVVMARARSLGQAERQHIRAKYVLKKAQLNEHQVRRRYGPASQQAARAASLSARASVALASASGALYAERILADF